MFDFLRTLFGLQGRKAVQSLTDELVKLDPKSATEAQLKVMEADLDKAGRLVAQMQQEANREEREAVEARARFNRMLAAAEHLNGQIAAETDPARTQSLNASLARLLGDLEASKASVETEEAEAVEANALLTEAQHAYAEKATDLKTAKTTLTKAMTDMQRAKIAEERAKAQSERAAQVAGLRTTSTGSLNAAVNAMQRQADTARQNAEANRLKARALAAPTNATDQDPNILAALAASTAQPQLGDLGSRLAALSGKPRALAAPDASGGSGAPGTTTV